MNAGSWSSSIGEPIHSECDVCVGYSAERLTNAFIKHYNQTKFRDVANPEIRFSTTADSAGSSNCCRIPVSGEPIVLQRQA